MAEPVSSSPGGVTASTGSNDDPGAAAPAAARPRDEAQRWPVSSSAELGRGQLFTFRRDDVRMPDGSAAGREYIEHPGSVAILALDDHERVLLIRQYRHPVAALLWEIPAGLRDVASEPAAVTAERELMEETGYRAADWRVLTDFFPSPGSTTEKLRIYLARGLTEVPAAEQHYVRKDEEASLAVAWLPLAAAVRGVLAGDLHNGVAAVGILSAYAARQDGFSRLRPVSAPETL
jgi:8-oxo-dGDP phosphatase